MTGDPSTPSGRADPAPAASDGTAPTTDAARGRELVLAALCHLETAGGDDRGSALELFWAEAPRDEDGRAITAALGAKDGEGAPVGDAAARRFARRLLDDIVSRWAEIDAQIEATSRRWRMARMDKIDRNALRLGVAELTSQSRVPRGVIVAEAVRVASRYGSERSGRFVNGILGDVAAAQEAGDGSAP